MNATALASNRFSKTIIVVLITILFAFLLLPDVPITRFHFNLAHLDPSWAATLAEMTAAGASQGRDLIFTGGPLSSLYTRYFQPQLAPLIIVFSAVVWASFVFVACAIAEKTRPTLVSVLLLVPLLTQTLQPDATFMAFPMLFALAQLQAPRSNHVLNGFIFAFAAAALVACKFSILPLALLSAVVMDLNALSKRSIPANTLLLFGFLFAIHVLTGSEASTFPLYLAMSLNTSAGYSDAMSMTGNPLRLAIYLVAIALFVFALAATMVRNLRGSASAFVELSVFLIFVGFIFLTFKSGFVRQDLHELFAWSGLTWATCAFLCIRWPTAQGGASPRVAILVAVALVASLATPVFTLRAAGQGPLGPVAKLEAAWAEAKSTYAAATDPHGWWDAQLAHREQARATLKATIAYPQFEGGVDMIASEQGKLIANGSDFTPRPTIQEYTTYTPQAIAANRAFFLGENAPKNLLLKPETIDTRYPSTAEGPLWPDFFRLYEIKGELDGHIWLVRRAVPLPDLLGPPTVSIARFRQPVPIQGDGPLFVKLDIRRTAIGSLVSMAYKLPRVMMKVTTSRGETLTFRLIPEIAREGFLLSPLVQSSTDMQMLLGDPEARSRLPKITSIELMAGSMASFYYDANIPVSIQNLDIPFAPANAFPHMMDVSAIVESNSMNPPMLRMTSEGVFAHPPSMLVAKTGGHSRLLLGFGIDAAAYAGTNRTNGVCFRALPENGSEPLFDRCLDPMAQPADRGVQTAEISLPAGMASIRLETACRDDCSFDWSYWSKARFE
ncbi:hypothetical protein ABLE91_19675 [Aquabacter sp. CN5-332]|uniref:hypothetical protein n=1 Tax=Aquabacter sp. CN5-332 TaxID=3156608 RepID=UPI0032B4866B